MKIQYGIPQLGDPSASYEPPECQHSDIEIPCSKIVNVTVNSTMDGKSYQCHIIIKREGIISYSQGGYLHGIAIIYSASISAVVAFSVSFYIQ